MTRQRGERQGLEDGAFVFAEHYHDDRSTGPFDGLPVIVDDKERIVEFVYPGRCLLRNEPVRHPPR